MSSYDDWIGRNIPDNIMDDAATWLASLDSELCTPADRMSFARWLREDTQHQAAFEELAEIWARLHMLPDLGQLSKETNVIVFPGGYAAPEPAKPRPAATGDWSTLVASLVITLGVLVHIISVPPSERLATDVGERQSVVLDDGSRVELDAKSSMDVQIDDKRREVRMPNGLAIFSVAADQRPFIVRTSLATISAVGTEFQVRSGRGRVEVSVVEGLVSVSASPASPALTAYGGEMAVRFADEAAFLGAGQRIEITTNGRQFETLSATKLNDALSWRDGEMIFDNEPLIAVLLQARRYFGANILVGDPRLNSLRVSGRFPTDNPQPLLQYLEQEFSLVIDTSNNRHSILRLPSKS